MFLVLFFQVFLRIAWVLFFVAVISISIKCKNPRVCEDAGVSFCGYF